VEKSMIALARSSCSRATANSPRVASSDCSSERSSPTIAGAVNGVGWSSAVARRAHPPTLLTTSAPSRIKPPCNINFWVFVCIDLSCKSRRSRTWPRLVKHPSIGRVAPPVTLRAARLLDQPHFFDHHGAGGSLHHVVDRQQRDRHSRESFHLHPRPAHCLPGGPDPPPRHPLVARRRHLHR